MPQRRHHLPLWLLILTLASTTLTLSPVRAETNLSFTLDAQVARVFTGNNTVDHNNGSGGYALLEFSPAEYFSLGVGTGFLYYWGIQTPNPTWSGSADAVLRLMPWGISPQGFASYILLGAGVNDLKGSATWQGDIHGMAGIGARFFLDPQTAVDLGGTYNIYTPATDPLQSLNAHLGISLFFNEVFKLKEAPEYDEDVQYRPGSIQSVAAREYGDASLFPILMDANFRDFSRPLLLPKGVDLVIPHNLTQVMIREAHVKAHQPRYLAAAATYNNPILAAAYREQAGPKTLRIPLSKNKKSSYPLEGESLWDVAARADVYGDPELYPLLVDANKKLLKNPGSARRLNLIVPQKLSIQRIREARLKAWAVEYTLWRGKDVNQLEYESEKIRGER